MPKVDTTYVLVGAGRCGLGLAAAMRAAGVPVAGIVARSPASRRRVRRLFPDLTVVPPEDHFPTASYYLLAVSDDALPEVAATVARRLTPGTTRGVFHTSGLQPAAVLEPCRRRGVPIASFHPLFAFPPPRRQPPRLAGALAAIEGSPTAVRACCRLARHLGMRPRRLAADHKPLYHAAAAVAGNLTHVLVALAKETLLRAGFRPGEAQAALAPLLQGACAQALAARGLERLTGALARNDAGTVAAHLAALPSEVAHVYRAIALAALPRLPFAQPGRTEGVAALVDALTPPCSCASVSMVPYAEGG